ncbi:hypothetical protein LTR37_020090 [Vermiconidia calcicola]|uniref:Uncharacterized protein n=1 Tax=Vermiconidia calcicola TaxID=1690605 RepID=A0ACC3ME93_9PEZI|nr:hypothetical protein LTR37_020090 [Vermiconidia calcicola]
MSTSTMDDERLLEEIQNGQARFALLTNVLADRLKTCPSCLNKVEIPRKTPCNHVLCAECITTWLAQPGRGGCPSCRSPVTPDQLRSTEADVATINPARAEQTGVDGVTARNQLGIRGAHVEDENRGGNGLAAPTSEGLDLNASIAGKLRGVLNRSDIEKIVQQAERDYDRIQSRDYTEWKKIHAGQLFSTIKSSGARMSSEARVALRPNMLVLQLDCMTRTSARKLAQLAAMD